MSLWQILDSEYLHTITISALETPNVLEDRIVIPGMTTTQWVQEHREIWGEDNGELAAMKYTYDSLGRILIQSKDEIRLSGLPSPDKADALMLAFCNPGSPLQLWV